MEMAEIEGGFYGLCPHCGGDVEYVIDENGVSIECLDCGIMVIMDMQVLIQMLLQSKGEE